MTHTTLRAIVVDDQELVRESVCDALRLTGHDVAAQAASGEEAVSLAQQLRPDIVLMDVQMPGIGGIEAARRIGGLPEPVPVVFLSALDDEVSAEQAAEAGGYGYLVKPFHARQLGPVMLTAIRRFRQESERREPAPRSDTTQEALARFRARVQAGALQAALDELLAAIAAGLSAHGVALCLLADGLPEGRVVASWGNPPVDAAGPWLTEAIARRQPAFADAETRQDVPSALLAVPLPPAAGAQGAILASRTASFGPAERAVMESCAAGLAETLGASRAQQPLAWRRWLHARHTDA